MVRKPTIQFQVLSLAAVCMCVVVVLAPAAQPQQGDATQAVTSPLADRQMVTPMATVNSEPVAAPRSRTKKATAGVAAPQSVSFQPAVTYVSGPAGDWSGSLAVADVNSDGKPDLIVVNVGQSESVGVLLGNGDGSFQPPILNTTLSQLGEANALAVADVNDDGKPDLIVVVCCETNGDNEAAVLLGNGDGTFQPPVLYDLGGSISSIAIADVNGDGRPDIISANYNGSTVTVLLGNGDGTFRSPLTSPGPVDSECLVVADVNGDGKPDALVCSEDTVAVLLGNGDGTFQPFANTNFYTGFCTNVPAIADLRGDGIVDLIAPNAGTNGCTDNGSAGVLLGTGADPLFQPEVDYPATTGNAPGVGTALVADLNGDGKPDAVIASGFAYIRTGFSSSVAVLLGNGDGTFQPAIQFSTASTGSFAMAVADLNGDGKPDIVTTADNQAAVSVLINNTQFTGAPTATGLASLPNPSIYGQSVTFTATVTSSSGTPTGTVVFYNGITSIGGAALAGGKVAISLSWLPAGSNSITAAYQGSSTFAPSTSSPLLQAVNVATTSTSLTSSLNPAGAGQSITFTAAVASQYGGTAAGSVTFYAGSQSIGTGSLSANVAALTTSFSSAGTYSITAKYTGDNNNSGSTSTALNEKIIASTSTTLTASPNPALVGQTITFTATVTSRSGTPPNGEIVSFYNGSTVLGTGALSGGVASFATSSLPAGLYSITANYPGDSNFAASTSPVLKQTVNATTKSATTTTLASSLNPSIYGQAITFTASVTTTGQVPPTGTVAFTWSGNTIGTAVLSSSGIATLTKSNMNTDAYPVVAVYKGDVNNLGSTSTVVNQVVNQTTSAATLTSSPNPSTSGGVVKFTADITSPTVIPRGPVTFAAGNAILGTAELSAGKATLSTSALPEGSTTVTVTYSGDSNIKGSKASVTQLVQ